MNPPKEPQPSQGAGAEAEARAAWEKFKETHKPCGQAVFYYKDNGEYWRLGYSKGREELEAQCDGYAEVAGAMQLRAEAAEEKLEIAFNFERQNEHLQARLASLESQLAEAVAQARAKAFEEILNWANPTVDALTNYAEDEMNAALSQLPGVEKDAERGSDGNAG